MHEDISLDMNWPLHPEPQVQEQTQAQIQPQNENAQSIELDGDLFDPGFSLEMENPSKKESPKKLVIESKKQKSIKPAIHEGCCRIDQFIDRVLNIGPIKAGRWEVETETDDNYARISIEVQSGAVFVFDVYPDSCIELYFLKNDRPVYNEFLFLENVEECFIAIQEFIKSNFYMVSASEEDLGIKTENNKTENNKTENNKTENNKAEDIKIENKVESKETKNIKTENNKTENNKAENNKTKAPGRTSYKKDEAIEDDEDEDEDEDDIEDIEDDVEDEKIKTNNKAGSKAKVESSGKKSKLIGQAQGQAQRQSKKTGEPVDLWSVPRTLIRSMQSESGDGFIRGKNAIESLGQIKTKVKDNDSMATRTAQLEKSPKHQSVETQAPAIKKRASIFSRRG